MKKWIYLIGTVLLVAACFFFPRLFLQERLDSAKTTTYTTAADSGIVQSVDLTLMDKLRLLASEDSVYVDYYIVDKAVEVPVDLFDRFLNELYLLEELGAISGEMCGAFLDTDGFLTQAIYVMNPNERGFILIYKVTTLESDHYALIDPDTMKIIALAFPTGGSIPQGSLIDSDAEKSNEQFLMMTEGWSTYFGFSIRNEQHFIDTQTKANDFCYYFRIADEWQNEMGFCIQRQAQETDNILSFMPLSDQSYAEMTSADERAETQNKE